VRGCRADRRLANPQSNNIMILPETFFGRHQRHMVIFNVSARASSP